MKRKRVVKVPTPDQMTCSDVLVVCEQTTVVLMNLLKSIDPNEAYDEWQHVAEGFTAIVEALDEVLAQHGEALDTLPVRLPVGLGLGGYRVEELGFGTSNGDLPF